jgi:two-component system, cell cycle response regulator
MDMDGLKQINDQLGHAAGDQALKQLAESLRHSFRDTDLLARLGGDEFVALAPGGKPEAPGLSDRLSRRVQVHLRAAAAGGAPLGVSIGAHWIEPAPNAQIETLLQVADEAMYAEKKQRGSRRPSVAADADGERPGHRE